MSRERLTHRVVWAFLCEGCNANEIAAYAGVSVPVAVAWMAAAARKHADRPAQPVKLRKRA
jgi:transposase